MLELLAFLCLYSNLSNLRQREFSQRFIYSDARTKRLWVYLSLKYTLFRFVACKVLNIQERETAIFVGKVLKELCSNHLMAMLALVHKLKKVHDVYNQFIEGLHTAIVRLDVLDW